MKRLLIPFLFIIAMWPAELEAQSWCPPGAEWRYSYFSGMDPLYQPYGLQEFRYMGDSLFQGELCQYIRSDLYLYDTTGVLQQFAPGSRFTSVTTDGAIRLYNTDVPGFDTLAWFGAPLGTTWTLHYPFNQDKVITVEDTGAQNVNGLLLRYLVVSSEPPATSFVMDTIFERIGALKLNNFNPLSSYFQESETLNGLGCYHDDSFSYVNPDGGLTEVECDSPVLVQENKAKDEELKVYPNPGNDRIWLSGQAAQQQTEFVIFDIRGVPVLKGEFKPELSINMSQLMPGVYAVVLLDRGGVNYRFNWVKL